MEALIPRRIGVITGAEVFLIVGLGTLAVFAGLATYAISKGYIVRRRTEDETWEFEPPASPQPA